MFMSVALVKAAGILESHVLPCSLQMILPHSPFHPLAVASCHTLPSLSSAQCEAGQREDKDAPASSQIPLAVV